MKPHCVNVSSCVCLCLYLESSVCPGNALHTGNALTGSYRTEAVAKKKKKHLMKNNYEDAATCLELLVPGLIF